MGHHHDKPGPNSLGLSCMFHRWWRQ